MNVVAIFANPADSDERHVERISPDLPAPDSWLDESGSSWPLVRVREERPDDFPPEPEPDAD